MSCSPGVGDGGFSSISYPGGTTERLDMLDVIQVAERVCLESLRSPSSPSNPADLNCSLASSRRLPTTQSRTVAVAIQCDGVYVLYSFHFAKISRKK